MRRPDPTSSTRAREVETSGDANPADADADGEGARQTGNNAHSGEGTVADQEIDLALPLSREQHEEFKQFLGNIHVGFAMAVNEEVDVSEV